ncbi:glycerophosphodiester phosphodiesterase family protein [Komagataeibacter sp. FXV3]|uniref:glycerophosphodiester phosphodiesterase family protein n=1 Tax=Komagataeibacter sp. FXV3 TaxID=2608998 RepID=UPI00187B65B3|nr:glycerophosphodiester phosphodiesterase family protein [Komagataeibacter sp. FXV3]MBE7729760.1 glycerophosphodiester phosphodiesterase [Komagataeibacter sp. FXV3]
MLTRRLIMTGALSGMAAMTARRAFAAPSLAPLPCVMAHRGASALRPEHTLAAYARAIADGADYIEPDLVPTKDGVLVARHESHITGTTDVASHPEFAMRRRTQTIDGVSETGWFTTDFTLAELKTLRARERLPDIRAANTRYDGHFDIPTFEEIIDFVAAEAATRGRMIGLIPEIKNATHFHQLGFVPEETFLHTIGAHEYTRYCPLEVQSFEISPLRLLHGRVQAINTQARLMLLMGERTEHVPDTVGTASPVTFGDLMTAEGLRRVRDYADVIGPSNADIIPRDATGAWRAPTSLIDDAHRAGLLVHSYTFRPENHFLPTHLRNDAGDTARNPQGSIAEIRHYLDMGLDGFFTDDPAIGRLALRG